MPDGVIGLDESTSPTKRLDTWQLSVGGVDVQRERVQIAGTASGELAVVTSGTPATNAPGLVVRPVTPVEVTVSGTLTVNAHAVTNAGTFAVQESGAALTALQLIDDTVKTDDAAFTPATDKILMIGFEYDEAGTDSVDEGDAGAARMSANRNQYVQIRDGAGNERGANVNASGEVSVKVADTLTVGSHAVTNAGTFAVQESGAALTALQIIDDWDESDRAKTNPIVGQAGISAASGNVAANTPRVTLAGDDRAVAALEIIDDWDESDRAKTNPIVGQAGVAASSGVITANTQRVVLANDDRAVAALEILDNAISGSEMQVDVVAALPAGTNAIGKLAANDGVDIGDVTVNNTNGTGAVNVQDVQPTIYTNFGAALAANVKNGNGILYQMVFTNMAASVRYGQIHNTTAAPATGATPVLSFPIPAGTTNQPSIVALGMSDLRHAFSTGISFAISAALGTYQSGATAGDHSVKLGYL